MSIISQQIEQYTAANSGFEERREYVSLSQIHLPEEDIIRQYFDGFKADHLARLKCYKGYQMERDLKDRIVNTFGNERVYTLPAVTAFDGIVAGHPDLLLDRIPADIKSVPLDEHLPVGRVPRRVFLQLQAYMLYGNWPRSLAIYESRETGRIADYGINPVVSVQNEIHAKLKRVVEYIVAQERRASNG